MTSAGLRRFILIGGAATLLMAAVWGGIGWIRGGAPGDYEVRQGDILLGDAKFGQAIERFDAALAKTPDHRGALLGKAAALIGLDRLDAAETLLTHTIEALTAAYDPADATGRGALAAAYANRGIVRDRQGRYVQALADYTASMQIDREIASGPGWIDWLLHYDRKPSSVAGRARYLRDQLRKPEAERLMRLPQLDAKQRMYKP